MLLLPSRELPHPHIERYLEKPAMESLVWKRGMRVQRLDIHVLVMACLGGQRGKRGGLSAHQQDRHLADALNITIHAGGPRFSHTGMSEEQDAIQL